MIALLKGVLAEKAAGRVIIDIQGVGYEVLIPLSTYYDLGEVGQSVTLRIYTHVAENALALYGFRTVQEKALFLQLIQISGIGPRLAITILSGLPVEELMDAISRADVHRLTSVPGVGKKTAERIVLELKDKLARIAPELAVNGQARQLGEDQKDVVSALINLGYSRSQAEKAVSKCSAEDDIEDFETLLKRSLKEISS
ncbi:MAG TPA: Holliday junction branch migration protein RuvA [Acidobacteriota bacterium]|nr:Holliday junction branch migration protein RuvA [Acidobacteriota bacterium]